MRRLPPRRSNPFRRKLGRRPLLVHCSHHKAGTMWFRRVLWTLSSSYGLRFQSCVDEPVARRTDFAFFRAAPHFHREDLAGRTFRGSHLIRDPRDIVVSGYFYHLWTEEKWARQPDGRSWGGLSYQEYLNSVDPTQGLLAEIERAAGSTLADMAAWDYEQPEFLELRYEDVITDEPTMFRRLFDFYGFDDKAIAEGLAVVEKVSIHSGGPDGLQKPRRHVRSGKTAQWRQHFGAEHVALFKELTGGLLVDLGYESDSEWSSESSDARTEEGD